jgi:8-oxo-dGTP diphosphatase
MAKHEVASMTIKLVDFSYEFPRPALTVDLVVLTAASPREVLLIQRKKEPFAKTWALAGGFVNEGETLAEAARRELMEETCVELQDIEQLLANADPERDPRGWTVTVAYLAIVNKKDVKPKAGDDAKAVKWFKTTKLPMLAFDHAMILLRALARVQERFG